MATLSLSHSYGANPPFGLLHLVLSKQTVLVSNYLLYSIY